MDLMKKYYKTMNWSSYDLPKVLKERGVDDPDKLPNFHYRDDALKLWCAIKEYITKILSFYYHSDEDIQQVSNNKRVGSGRNSRKIRNNGVEAGNARFERREAWTPLLPFQTKATHIIELHTTCS